MGTLESTSSTHSQSPSPQPTMGTLESTSSTHSQSPSPQPASIRLWRPAAQRNLKNQWLKLASYRKQFGSSSSSGRCHATSLVNTYLSQRYIHAMELGVLSDMPNICEKACLKLSRQQELHRSKLLSSYKDMVASVTHMFNTSKSMKCYLKGTSSSPVGHFSSSKEDASDMGDGGGIPVFAFLSVSSIEKLARELVQMFALELCLKRMIVVELLFLSLEKVAQNNGFCWSDEIYEGEFDNLSACSLYSKETCEPVHPSINGLSSDSPVVHSNHQPDQEVLPSNHQPDQEVLQVYLTTWLAEVNVDTFRVDEIFAIIGEEMHINIS